MSATKPQVLVVGDTPRWINSVKETLPVEVEPNFRTDYDGSNELLHFEDKCFNLLIVALSLGNKNEGLRILREFRLDDKNTPFIIFSRVNDEDTQKEIADLGGIIVRPQNFNGASAELGAKITELLDVAA